MLVFIHSIEKMSNSWIPPEHSDFLYFRKISVLHDEYCLGVLTNLRDHFNEFWGNSYEEAKVAVHRLDKIIWSEALFQTLGHVVFEWQSEGHIPKCTLHNFSNTHIHELDPGPIFTGKIQISINIKWILWILNTALSWLSLGSTYLGNFPGSNLWILLMVSSLFHIEHS